MAGVFFIATTHVSWSVAGLIAAGSIIGGQVGGTFGRRLPAPVLRWAIVIVGWPWPSLWPSSGTERLAAEHVRHGVGVARSAAPARDAGRSAQPGTGPAADRVVR